MKTIEVTVMKGSDADDVFDLINEALIEDGYEEDVDFEINIKGDSK